MNFPEFDGTGTDGWIAKAEKYFDAARMSLDQRTDYAVTNLKGRAHYWWRSTGCNALTLPWHQFCRMIEERFTESSIYDNVRFCRMIGDKLTESSIYDNVRMFHWLRQTGSVKVSVDQFEEIMSLVRRDNPLLPDEYYVCSFVAGLQDYIPHNLQCHRARNMIEAIWMARRIEQSHPFKNKSYAITPGRVITVTGTREWPKQVMLISHVMLISVKKLRTRPKPANNVQVRTGKDYGKCRKRPEQWFPGHKCKV